jgi:hypothetical protein
MSEADSSNDTRISELYGQSNKQLIKEWKMKCNECLEEYHKYNHHDCPEEGDNE